MTTPRRIRFALVTVVVLAVAWLLWQARGALIPFFVGGVIAYVLSPLVERINRRMPFRDSRPDLARTLSVLTVYVVAAAILIGIGSMIVPVVIRETVEFVDNLPAYVDEARAEADKWTRRYREDVPPNVQERVDAALQDFGASLGEYGQGVLTRTFGILTNTFGLFFGYIVIPFWLFYVLKDRPRLGPTIQGWFPPWLQEDVDHCIRIVQRVLGSYIRAQLTLGVFIGVITAIGLFFLDVQFWAILAVIAGITELIPIIGPILGALPALVVVLATDPGKFIWVLLFYVVVQQVENAILVPRMQGNAVEMHPALIIVLLAIAQQLAGFGGMLIVVPLAAVARDVFKYVYTRLKEREAIETDERVLRRPRPRDHPSEPGVAAPVDDGVPSDSASTKDGARAHNAVDAPSERAATWPPSGTLTDAGDAT